MILGISTEHAAVDTMIAIGVPFEYIQDYINALSLPSEQLGALRLLAWAEATGGATGRRALQRRERLTLVPSRPVDVA